MSTDRTCDHTPQPHWRCRAHLAGDALQLLRQLGADGRIDADHIAFDGEEALLVLREREIDLLQGLGLTVECESELQAQARRVRAERALPRRAMLEAGAEASSLQTGFVDHYMTTAEIVARFDSLHAAFPALTSWTDLPFQSAGYDGSVAALRGPATVKLFRITTTQASLGKPGLLLVAGIHAREWMPPLAAIEFAEQLLRTYTPGSTVPAVAAINALVEGLDILIVPAANPDGINFSHFDDAMWRKNRRDNPPPASPACNGVDNNRNYGIFFGDAGSSGDPCNESFRGPAAFSESENRNVLHVLERFPNILTAVDCHSFGDFLFRAQPTGGAFIASEPVEPRDHAIFLGLEAAMNAAVATVTPGKSYSTGTTNNHAGTLDDYLFLAHRVFGFTLECGQDFQPPIATAITVVAEVAAALRALATATLGLAAQFSFPVAIALALDRSGSMRAAGYDVPTLADARRVVDLMSLNDQVSVSSFASGARVDVARRLIANPGDYAAVRSGIDGIDFGGATSIGAGLQAAAGTLAGVSGARAVLLLSDGFQNRAPFVADVLPALPAGLKVHTIALGPASDQPLLESIATSTGGQYSFAPDALALHEIYNTIRAEAHDEALALNESVPLLPGEGERRFTAIVDEGATHVSFSLAWDDPGVELQATLLPPSGPVMDLARVRRSDGRGYRLLRLRRPQAGAWQLVVKRKPGGTAVRCNVAAFLKSSLRLRLSVLDGLALAGRPLRLRAAVDDGGHVLGGVDLRGTVSAPQGDVAALVKSWRGPFPKPPAALTKSGDALPKPVLQALAIQALSIRQGKPDPLRHAIAKLAADTTHAQGLVLGRAATGIPGSYVLSVRAQGRAPSNGSPFVRVAQRTVRVVATIVE